MTNHIKNPMHGIVRDVIAGSMITQLASKCGLDTDQLLNSSAPDTAEIFNAITEFGLNPDITAAHTLLSITCYLKDPQMVDINIEHVSKLLWNSLGDPEHNGDTPPAQYKKAAEYVYAWFIHWLMPSSFSSSTHE